MSPETEKICNFASRHFNINCRMLLSHSTTDECSIARYMVWHYLHQEKKVSAAVLAKDFCRTKRAIFAGLSKIRNGIKKQKYYKDIYSNFKYEYDNR